MPKPRQGESESDFVERCIPIVLDDGAAETNDQAVAMCHSLYEDSKSMTANDKLLAAIKARGMKSEPWNGGILTADSYVRTLQECVGIDACNKFVGTRQKSFDDVLRKAAKTLTYNNPEMVVEEKVVDEYSNVPRGIELPKNTLMVFRHVLTTPRKDRDGDVLRTEGMKPDPKMLLLWQHVHTLPIGKMLKVHSHTKKSLVLWSAIVDMNELCHDAATMIDNDMGRFSHGFRALVFEEMKAEEGETTSPGGFDIKEGEIMEESVVSVPSNTDAETEEVVLSLLGNGKLTSPLMKSMGSAKERNTTVRSAGGLDINININGGTNADVTGNGTGKAAACGCGGGASKEADEDDRQAAKAEDEEMMCPECGGKMEDGVCTKCGYKEEKTSPDTDNADAYNDMGEDLCPNCSTVSLDENGKCPNCGFQRSADGRNKATVGGKKMYVYPGMITGSWEYTEMKLREVARSYLIGKGVGVGEHDWVSLVATFADSAIVCHEQRGGKMDYYQADWKLNDEGNPVFDGDPKSVKIEVSANIMEKLFGIAGTKAGRVLSAKNLKTLKAVRDDIEEMMDKETSLTRGGNALCERCVKRLDDVIGPDDEDDDKTAVTRDAGALFVANATKQQRADMHGALQALDAIDTRSNTTKEYLALMGK